MRLRNWFRGGIPGNGGAKPFASEFFHHLLDNGRNHDGRGGFRTGCNHAFQFANPRVCCREIESERALRQSKLYFQFVDPG